MKTNKIIFWVTTGIIAAMMLMSSAMYLTKNPEITKGLATLGYPAFMVGLLGIAKLLAAIGLLQPVSPKVREWAYAGLTFTFIGAVWSHVSTGTPFVMPLVFLVILGISLLYNNKIAAAKSN